MRLPWGGATQSRSSASGAAFCFILRAAKLYFSAGKASPNISKGLPASKKDLSRPGKAITSLDKDLSSADKDLSGPGKVFSRAG